MLTRRARGFLREQLLAASDLRKRLGAEGFPVTWIKVEAILESEGAPQSDEEAARQPAERYFEHHLKLILAPEADHEALAYTAEQHASQGDDRFPTDSGRRHLDLRAGARPAHRVPVVGAWSAAGHHADGPGLRAGVRIGPGAARTALRRFRSQSSGFRVTLPASLALPNCRPTDLSG